MDRSKKAGELSENDVEEFLESYLKDRQISGKSIYDYWRALMKFLEHIREYCQEYRECRR